MIVFMLSLQCSFNAFHMKLLNFLSSNTYCYWWSIYFLIQPTPNTPSGCSSKAYFHPHCQSRRVAVKASSCTSLLYCASASTLARTLLFASYEFQSICTWKAYSRACGASKAFISFSTSVSLREQTKWTCGQQSSWSTDGNWSVSFAENEEFTLKWKNGWRTEYKCVQRCSGHETQNHANAWFRFMPDEESCTLYARHPSWPSKISLNLNMAIFSFVTL